MAIGLMDSILGSTKNTLGIEEEYEHFDMVLITHINSTFSTLNQLGIGPSEGFMIKDRLSTWGQFLGDRKDLEMVKSYTYLRVRLLWDPPHTSYLLNSLQSQLDQLEWRLEVQGE